MKRIIISLWVLSAAGLGGISTAPAQGLPKTQPKLLTITREEVKIGRNEEHSKHEAGWPAAYEKAKSTEPEAVRNALLSTRGLKGVEGTYNFEPNGDGVHGYNVVRNEKGTIVYDKHIDFND